MNPGRKSFLVRMSLGLFLFVFCGILFAQTLDKITVYSEDNKVVAVFEPARNIGTNYIVLYKGLGEKKYKFVVSVKGNDLPDRMTMKTNMDKEPEYLHSILESLYVNVDDQASLDNKVKTLIDAYSKSSPDPFLSNKTRPDYAVVLSPLLYKDMIMTRTSVNGDISEYSLDANIKLEQTANLVFQITTADEGKVYLPIYYEATVHHKNIHVVNLVVSPEASKHIKSVTSNPYQLGEAVDYDQATPFKVVNRTNWMNLFNDPNGRTSADESEIFETEKVKVMPYDQFDKSNPTSTEGTKYLQVLKLDDPKFIDKVVTGAKNTNANQIWLMPIHQMSALRMGANYRKARIIKIGDKEYVVTDKHDVGQGHTGPIYPHESTSYTVSDYLGGDESARNMINILHDKGYRVMLEEHPDKVASFFFEYKDVSYETQKIFESILRVAGYEIDPSEVGKPLDLFATKLRSLKDGSSIRSYQFFMLKYDYIGRDIPGVADYVEHKDRIPGDPSEMPSNLMEIYTPIVANSMLFSSFAQLKSHNLFVELMDRIAKKDYYKKVFGDNIVDRRIDAIHMSPDVNFNERAAFVRDINEYRISYKGAVIAGEVMGATGEQIAWYAMPIDIVQPPTPLHRDNVDFMIDGGTRRTALGQLEWEFVIKTLQFKDKLYISALSSYDTCAPISEEPFNKQTWKGVMKTYANYFDAFTKEAYVYFAPGAVNTVCAGEECGTQGDFKNFKGDQFGFLQLPYEAGNSDPLRVDLSTMYPTVDLIKAFITDKKYGSNPIGVTIDVGTTMSTPVEEAGFLTAQAFVSDLGVVMAFRNTADQAISVDVPVDISIQKALADRKLASEDLRVVFDFYEFPYTAGTKDKSALYMTDGSSLLLKEVKVGSDNKITLSRTLKPYETILLTTLTKGEMQEIRSQYLKEIIIEKMDLSEAQKETYRKKSTYDIFSEWFTNNASQELKDKKDFGTLLTDAGLLEWLTNDQSNPKRYLQAEYLLDLAKGIPSTLLSSTQNSQLASYQAARSSWNKTELKVDTKTYGEKVIDYLKGSSKNVSTMDIDELMLGALEKVISRYKELDDSDTEILFDKEGKDVVNYFIDKAESGDAYAQYRVGILSLVLGYNIDKIKFTYDARYTSFEERAEKYKIDTKSDIDPADRIEQAREEIRTGNFRFVR